MRVVIYVKLTNEEVALIGCFLKTGQYSKSVPKTCFHGLLVW